MISSDRIIVEEYIQETPDEPQTELESLLEDSDRVYQHNITKFQMAQQEQLMKYEKRVLAWGDDERAKGTFWGAIKERIAAFMHKARQDQKKELRVFKEQTKIIKDIRDTLIREYVLESSKVHHGTP